jgi:creatinine amidohydrolase
MKTALFKTIMGILMMACPIILPAQVSENSADSGLSVFWEELTSADFKKAVEKSSGVCLLPLGVIEKHGPHLPLGTDLYGCREVSMMGAEREYAIVFPPYFATQIFEAKHQPGTIAYSAGLQLQLLQETCDEIARNGIKKIIIVNGHGGNQALLPFFIQSQLASPRDYAVYLFSPNYTDEENEAIQKLSKAESDGHAGESETSRRMVHRSDLIHLDRAGSENYENKDRTANLKDAYVGIWWYASYPNHYAGPAELANQELGQVALNIKVDHLVEMIRSVKSDTSVLKLQDRFYRESSDPLNTEQDQ